MEDESSSSWIKSATTFSSQSLLRRQVLAAISGLLVNLIITQLLVWCIDEDLRSSSFKSGLVSMLLAFIFRNLKNHVQSHSCGTYSGMDADATHGQEEISTDYSIFTCFRFPVLDPNLLSLMTDDDDQGSNSEEQVPEMEHLEPSSSHHLQWVASAPPSTNQNPRSIHCILHKNLLSQSASFQPALFPKFTARSQKITHERNHPRKKQDSGLWACQFLEEANFAQFKNGYAVLRTTNNSSSTHSDTVEKEASGSDPHQRKEEKEEAPVTAGRRVCHQLPRPAAQLQVLNGRRKTVDKSGRRKNGCLETFLSSFCNQTLRQEREQRQQKSRGFSQISSHDDAPWP